MENKQWLHQWLDQGAYKQEDIRHIVGKRLMVDPAQPYTYKDVLNIVGPPARAEKSRGPSG